MPTTTPLTDAIEALTTYSNTVTGASDTTLSEAVATLASGYGGGGTSYTLDIGAFTSNSEVWNSPPIPNSLSSGGYLEAKLMLASQSTTPNILSIGTTRSYMTNWNTTNAIHFMLSSDMSEIYVRAGSQSYGGPAVDLSVPHILKVDKDYVYIDGTPVVATHANIKNASTVSIGSVQGSNRFSGSFEYIHFN